MRGQRSLNGFVEMGENYSRTDIFQPFVAVLYVFMPVLGYFRRRRTRAINGPAICILLR